MNNAYIQNFLTLVSSLDRRKLLVGLVVVIVIGYIYSNSSNQNPGSNQSIVSRPSNQEEISIKDLEDQIVTTTPKQDLTEEDFEKAKLKNPEALDRGTIYLVNTDEYVVIKYAKDDAYQITVSKPPFSITRPQAEKAFLEVTGFTQEQACNKNVYITVATQASAEYGGKVLKLSFCK